MNNVYQAASCFSGIGAPELAGQNFNWIWHSEIEPFPIAVLKHHHPKSENLGDITAGDFIERAQKLGKIDLLAGGPPCQAFSVAGLRQSMNDDRGNLSLKWVEILNAIQPRNGITENVPGWLNTRDNAFGCFLGAISGSDDVLHSPIDNGRWPSAGMVEGPRSRSAWRIFDAQYFGVAQRRRRVFVVTDFGNGVDPAKILFEPKSMQRDYKAGKETGQTFTGYTASSFGKYSEGVGTLRSQGGDLGGGSETILTVEPPNNEPFFVSDGQKNAVVSVGKASTLTATHEQPYIVENERLAPMAIANNMAVRRLTPIECERLQGFPDNFTNIEYKGKPASDGNRYKALGNSWAVPVGRFIIDRIYEGLIILDNGAPNEQ